MERTTKPNDRHRSRLTREGDAAMRALKRLDLCEEYESARADGKISPGNRIRK